MQKGVLYGIVAAIVVVGSVGVAFGLMSISDSAAVNQHPRSSDSDVRIIKHAMGETEIEGTPARIVVVDGELAENLFTLNAHSPIVGASLWEIYGTSFEQEMREINLDVPSNVVDTGDYWAPNLELIAQLEPDVIIASDAWNRQNYGAFSKIAPTLMFSTHPTEDDSTSTLQEMEENFMALANLVGKQREGARVLESLDAKLDNAAAKVESAGLKGHKFLLAEMWVDNGSLTMFLYTKNSVASQILERVGLQNALTSDANAPWGVVTVGTEAIASLDDPNLHFFFGHYNTLDGVNTYNTLGIFKNNPVIKTLEFVKRDKVYELGHAFKPRPTPRHMEVLVDKVLPSLVAGAGETRTIAHAMGETEITDTPKRIVALDWSASEILLAMDISPLAVTNLESMEQFLKPEGLSPDIVDVGNSFEPNLEKIAELEPDLILAETFGQSALYDELSSIAPTVMYSNSPPLAGSPTHLESLEQNIILVADAVNKRDRGVEIVDRLHAKYEQAAEKIEAAGLKGTKYVVGAVDPPYGEYTTSTLRFFDNTFFMSQMLSRMGLENAVTEEYGRANWGMKVVGLEGLAAIDGPDVHLFYIHAEGQDAFENEWENNPVWTNLEIAKEGNSHPLGTLYVYGGPEQMAEMIDKVVDALT